MRQEVYICDECGKTKQESNHWIQYFRSGWRTVSFHPWSSLVKEHAGHLCGQECAHSLLNKVLGEAEDAHTAG